MDSDGPPQLTYSAQGQDSEYKMMREEGGAGDGDVGGGSDK